jgi:hypothetical protein
MRALLAPNEASSIGVSRIGKAFPAWMHFSIRTKSDTLSTPQSVTLAIQEELSKQVPGTGEAPGEREPEAKAKSFPKASEATEETEKLREQVRDLEILGRVKDQVIKTFEKDRDAFNEERQRYISQLMAHSRKVGELETRLLQLGAPVAKEELPQSSEGFGKVREGEEGLGNY